MTHDDDFREDDGRSETIDETISALFDEWCNTCQRFHQPRDHAVKCALCNGMTWRVHGICDAHQITTNG